MTLDEAIEMYTSNAEYERQHGNLQGCLEFRQLAEWLKDYKRLLEQESVLDKIRTDIEQLHYHPKLDFIKNDDVVEMALKIIDKYKGDKE